eukprot:456381-Prymnesium_polylepis.1
MHFRSLSPETRSLSLTNPPVHRSYSASPPAPQELLPSRPRAQGGRSEYGACSHQALGPQVGRRRP